MSVMPPEARPKARIAGCDVDVVTMQQALGWCLETCRSEGPARILLTANASHLVMMQDDPALRDACAASDFIVADGMSVVWASRLLGTPLPERVTGIDLFTELLRVAPQHRLRVFLLGAKPEVIARLATLLEEGPGGIKLAGWRDGYFGPADEAAVVRDVAAARPDILFVGMPSPFKDIWCERHRAALGARLVIGVGGAFDVLAGDVRRAPGWMQRGGLEWFWRFLLEPRRLWRRYLIGNCRFVGLIMAQRFLLLPLVLA